jgi:hypothetical protein
MFDRQMSYSSYSSGKPQSPKYTFLAYLQDLGLGATWIGIEPAGSWNCNAAEVLHCMADRRLVRKENGDVGMLLLSICPMARAKQFPNFKM